MIKIGITGGIGGGKSVVAELMRVMNIPVYNADNASKNLLKTNYLIQEKLRKLLGGNIFSGGELNRAQMASLIFSDNELLARTNAIIHPAVFDDFNRWCNCQQSNIVACESAIVFESGINRFLDCVILVSAPAEVRIERATTRDHVNREQIISRIKSQMPDEEKAGLSNFVIINDNRRAIIPQLHKILSSIRELKTRKD